MSLKMMGKKRGMTRLFDEKGNIIVCTVIEAEPNVVVQIKSLETDGYDAVQMGMGKVPSSKMRNVTKPLKGHFAKAKVEPRKHLSQFSSTKEETFEMGQEVGVEYFANTKYVDVSGISKGKGFQGVIKRHNFAGGPASHGSSKFHRTGGSTGMRSTPGRCLPGQKMAGHMGNEKVTTECLKVVQVDAEKKLILVQGAIPGSRGSLVYIRKSVKKSQGNKK